MIKKTKDYGMFKFRNDNRDRGVNHNHAMSIARSIKEHNMLDKHPILVNKDMEVMDGQHRLVAAKHIGVEIYYQVDETIMPKDIIRLNISKSWGLMDILNFYCKNGYIEYQNISNFMKENGLTLKVALNICKGKAKNVFKEFRDGDFVYDSPGAKQTIENCWDTIETIKKSNGFSPHTDSARFWESLLKLFNHADFDITKWTFNLERFSQKIRAKATVSDYIKMFCDVYNWRNNKKIKLWEEESEIEE